jgi:nickel-dependent lactate racemase
MYNARRAVRDGGVVIILSESREGIGNDNFKTIFTEHPTRREREEKLAKDYDIASFEGYSLSLWQEDVDFLVMSSIPEDELKQMGLIPIGDINQGLNYAYKKLGKNLRTYVMPHGSITFPMKGE